MTSLAQEPGESVIGGIMKNKEVKRLEKKGWTVYQIDLKKILPSVEIKPEDETKMFFASRR